jgi:hypothetical protein
MMEEYNLTLRQLDGARGDLQAIADELETVKMMLTRLPSRAHLSRTVLIATARLGALLGAVTLLLIR